jgi:hypothetical protein
MAFPVRDLDGLVGFWRLEGEVLGKRLCKRCLTRPDFS